MVLDQPNQIAMMRLFTLIQGIELYLKSGMKLTRIATPANMRTWASEYTGIQYKRSRQGLESAAMDLRALYERAKT